MYERRGEPPIPRRMFLRRLAGHFAVAASLLLVSLAAGMAGYMYFEGHGWGDAFLSAAMLLAGLGIVETPGATGTKLFVGVYALYCGLVFVIMAGIILAPALHRMLHTFHWDQDEASSGE